MPTQHRRPARPRTWGALTGTWLVVPSVLVLVALTVYSVVGLFPTAATAATADAAAPEPSAVQQRDRPAVSAAPSPASSPPRSAVKDRGVCPARFAACVDLRTQDAWLQRGDAVVFGPTPFMPGAETGRVPPGPTSSATPTGAFTVLSKNATQVSSEYGDPMPFAVFFAPGGIAFHEGSLSSSSHGCVHLGPAAAKAFFHQLHVGDAVLVF